jgi:hypothetical protein
MLWWHQRGACISCLNADARFVARVVVVGRTVDVLGEQGFLQYRELLPPTDESL